MGFRTIVILYNDQASEWEKDPDLGKKIAFGMNHVNNDLIGPSWDSPSNLHYGNIVECVHADVTSLLAVDGYYARRIGIGHHSYRTKSDEVDLELVRNAANSLGYKLVKATK